MSVLSAPDPDPALAARLTATIDDLDRLRAALLDGPPAGWTHERTIDTLVALLAASAAARQWLAGLASATQGARRHEGTERTTAAPLHVARQG